MKITVINNKTQKSTICSKKDAAKLVGVNSITILRWSYDNKIHQFNHFTLYFHTEIIKQKPRGSFSKLPKFT